MNSENSKNLLYIFLLVFAILFFAYFGLLRLDAYYYIDDNARVLHGLPDFVHFSRRVSQFGAYFLSMRRAFFDFSPLPQILGLGFLALTGVFVTKIFTKEYKLWLALPLSLLGIFPFFRTNMTYTYDAIFMCLSVLFGVIPFLFMEKKVPFFLLSMICILGVTTSYQTSLSIYPILAIFVILDQFFIKKNTKKAIQIGFLSFFAFILSVAVFKFFIYNPFTGYIDTSTLQNNRIENFKNSFPLLNDSIILQKSALFGINLLIPLIFLFAFVFASPRNKFFSFLGAGGALGISAILSIAFQILYVPGGVYRYYTSYVFLIMLLAVYVWILLSKNKRLRRGASAFFIVSVIHLFFMTASYANHLKHQWEYDKFRLTLVATDLSNLIKNKKNYHIIFKKKKLQEATKNNSDFKKIYIERSFSHLNMHEVITRFLHFPFRKGKPIEKKGEVSIVLDNMFHRIEKVGDYYYYVNFK